MKTSRTGSEALAELLHSCWNLRGEEENIALSLRSTAVNCGPLACFLFGQNDTMPWKKIQRAIGMCEGGQLRSVMDQLWAGLGLDRLTARTPGSRRVAFTIAVVTLAAKMSKADGVSTPVEAEAFERMFQVSPDELEQIRRVFQLASQDVAGYEAYASQIGRLLADEPDLKRTVLECLFHVASADGILHPAEDRFLKVVASHLGMPDTEFRAVRRAFVVDPDSPYEVLGVAPDVSDQTLKLHYRELVKTLHPDALVAKGVPAEFLAAAQRRLAAINVAHEAILAERGQRIERALEKAP